MRCQCPTVPLLLLLLNLRMLLRMLLRVLLRRSLWLLRWSRQPAAPTSRRSLYPFSQSHLLQHQHRSRSRQWPRQQPRPPHPWR